MQKHVCGENETGGQKQRITKDENTTERSECSVISDTSV
jgi:hypothetical protein